MKILLTGKNGQLGFELQRSLALLGELVAIDQEECDLADPSAVRALVRDVVPSVIVNPAAYTAVDQAETEKEQAHAVNSAAPGILGEEARRLRALVVHYSTDHVFDGTQECPYQENDVTNPQNVYGRSKRDGEIALTGSTPDHLILRTSWVVGAHGNNFAKTMLKLAQEQERLKVVADQVGAPTSAALLADVTSHLIRQWTFAKADFPYGIYHCTARGETNWHEYARWVVGKAVNAGVSVKATPDQIQAIPAREYPAPAKRPVNSRLDCSLFRQTFGLELPDWQKSLDPILNQILKSNIDP